MSLSTLIPAMAQDLPRTHVLQVHGATAEVEETVPGPRDVLHTAVRPDRRHPARRVLEVGEGRRPHGRLQAAHLHYVPGVDHLRKPGKYVAVYELMNTY